MDFLELLARPVFLLARFLLWLAWDVLFLEVAWSIGWPLVRTLTFGRFPQVGFREYEECGAGEAFVVCGIGLGVLVAIAWGLASHFGLRW